MKIGNQHYYIHKEFVWPILFFGACSALPINEMINHNFSFSTWLLLMGSLSFVLLSLYLLWYYRKDKEIEVKTPYDLKVLIEQECIKFPEAYHFAHSSVHKNRIIYKNQINEIDHSSTMISIVINENEVVFIPRMYLKQILRFVKRNNILLTERLDIWGAINEPYLDMEFSAEEKRNTTNQLIENGLTKQEIKSIRKRIRFVMFSNFFLWEEYHLGLFDFLNWSLFLKKSTYWWAMEIALRNFKSKPLL